MKKGDRLLLFNSFKVGIKSSFPFWKKVACPLLLIAITAGELSAREKTIKIGIHGKRGPSRIEIVQARNTRLFLGDVLVTEPVLMENRSGNIHLKVGKSSFSKHGIINLQSYGRGFWISGPEIPRRLYAGNLEISKKGDALKIINQLPIETYLVSVVAGETSDLNQKEAFRAQAVAARTYTLAHTGRHKKAGFDLCDLTHCHLYAGFANISEDIRWAVDTTRGEVITYGGKLISAFYHSACGGRTESVVYVWSSIHKPYLTSVQDGPPAKPYCSSSPKFDWTTRIPVYQLQKTFSKLGWINPKDTLRRVKVSQRSPSGRALTITLYAGSPRSKVERGGRETDVSGTDFYHGIGRTMGWNKIRSTMFELTMENASPASAKLLGTGSRPSWDLSGSRSPSPEAEGSPSAASQLPSVAALPRDNAGGEALAAHYVPVFSTGDPSFRARSPEASKRGYAVFKGKGSGHGVGMCQWGAQGMASKGASYREILLHYYPKTKIKLK